MIDGDAVHDTRQVATTDETPARSYLPAAGASFNASAGLVALGGTVLLHAVGGAAPAEAAQVITIIGNGSVDSSANAAITDVGASRFLAQASMGANRTQIAAVKALGYAGWLNSQFVLPVSGTRWDWLVVKGFSELRLATSEKPFTTNQAQRVPDTGITNWLFSQPA